MQLWFARNYHCNTVLALTCIFAWVERGLCLARTHLVTKLSLYNWLARRISTICKRHCVSVLRVYRYHTPFYLTDCAYACTECIISLYETQTFVNIIIFIGNLANSYILWLNKVFIELFRYTEKTHICNANIHCKHSRTCI